MINKKIKIAVSNLFQFQGLTDMVSGKMKI